jgi:hypothetical protein
LSANLRGSHTQGQITIDGFKETTLAASCLSQQIHEFAGINFHAEVSNNGTIILKNGNVIKFDQSRHRKSKVKLFVTFQVPHHYSNINTPGLITARAIQQSNIISKVNLLEQIFTTILL